MAHQNDTAFDAVTWARRVNARWIVHQGLRESASAYLDHLERIDPARLRRSCRNARRLVAEGGSTNDPKPWFYAGLFSLVSTDEAERFLAGHWFTAACLPGLPETLTSTTAPQEIGVETKEKLAFIRVAVEALAVGD